MVNFDMKTKLFVISALLCMFLAVSCDSGVKFDNPNDKNSDAYQGDDDADSNDDKDAEDSGDDTDSGDDEDAVDPDVTDTGETVGEKRVSECTGLPENAVWNSVSSIKQTWDGERWTPSKAGTYSDTSCDSECCFKCETNYKWNGEKCLQDADTSDSADSGADTGDTASDTGDTVPDTGDTVPDTGDTSADEDAAEVSDEDPEEGKNCTETQCFKEFTCSYEGLLTTYSGSVTGHCNISTCSCDPGWYTATSADGEGETVSCIAEIYTAEKRNNVLCTVCDVDNPPSNYASTGCPANCYENFCNGTGTANGQGSCYTEKGTHKVYCKCASGYTMTGESQYYDENPTGQCLSE